MNRKTISLATAATVLFFLVAALLIRSWLQVTLQQNGFNRTLAADVSYLVVPLILLVTVAPLWREIGPSLMFQFRYSDLSPKLLGKALLLGLLMRVIWWAQLTVGVALGWYASDTVPPQAEPFFKFQCPDVASVVIGLAVMTLLVPIIEECISRGILQTAAMKFGATFAIVLSASVFALLHMSDQWGFTIVAGLVFGFLFWATHSLWASLFTHAAYNSMTILDWRCLSAQWNPAPETIPMTTIGSLAALLLLLLIGASAVILCSMVTEAHEAPR